MHISTCVYQGVRNVSFSENFAYVLNVIFWNKGKFTIWFILNYFCRLWEVIPELGRGRHVKHTFGNYFVQLADMASHPRIIRTHLPYEKAPVHPKSKCIYISRNPFDTAVSLFNELKSINEFSGSFEDFFTYFIHGQTCYNDYFDHQKSWFQRRSNQYVLWITYEDLSTYPRTVIKQIGSYMGGVYERSANDEYIMKEILKHTSYKEMETHENLIVSGNPNRGKGQSFFHNGRIGQYKNIFSDTQIKQLVAKLKREFDDLPLIHSWDKYKFPSSLRN